MEIYTSNYASIKKLPAHLTPVSISVGVPKWFKGAVDKRLAPTWVMMKKPREVYDSMFADALSKLDAERVLNQLPENPVLLCYESHNDWCHRRMVAEWFENELGIVVPEYGFERDQTFPYKECCKANAGKVRKVENEQAKEEVTEANVTEQEPEAVRLRRESYNKKPSIFDFEF
ncbi:hypothetical protein H7K13_23640 [Priestia aryabhattai]|uniref:hypothetical protein n=1 Tax=Priestia aryabhattai TaxID=412384 RepID=UPI001C8DEE04|nr:hypothetical protein [Priestia aryabhattai]MBY0077924.1 hypothetical protein [Priestia aryabhattai]